MSNPLLVFTLFQDGSLDHTGFLRQSITGKWLETAVCAVAASGFLLFGYDREFPCRELTEGSWRG